MMVAAGLVIGSPPGMALVDGPKDEPHQDLSWKGLGTSDQIPMCDLTTLSFDRTGTSSFQISKGAAEYASRGVGIVGPAELAVLVRVTQYADGARHAIVRRDVKGVPIRARPAWILWFTGQLIAPPGGHIPAKPDQPPPSREPQQLIRAALTVIDAHGQHARLERIFRASRRAMGPA